MELVIFVITAIVAIVGAIAMLISRNAVHSALFLLLNFGAIAVLYLLLQAPFLFAVQLIVYAGAIIVLFLFVVMLLGAERDEEDANPIRWQAPVAITMAVLLIGEIIWVLVRQSQDSLARVGSSDSDFGSPAQIAQALFTTHLLPFEVASFVLLTALIGVVVLHQRQN